MNKTLKIGIGIIAADILIAKMRKPRIIIKDKLPFNANGQTLPPVGIYLQTEDSNNKNLLAHEMVHWEQYQRYGLIGYYSLYFLQNFFFGYDEMPMEIEARKRSGEKAECITNYIHCVRCGKSNTVFEPDFLK